MIFSSSKLSCTALALKLCSSKILLLFFYVKDFAYQNIMLNNDGFVFTIQNKLIHKKQSIQTACHLPKPAFLHRTDKIPPVNSNLQCDISFC